MRRSARISFVFMSVVLLGTFGGMTCPFGEIDGSGLLPPNSVLLVIKNTSGYQAQAKSAFYITERDIRRTTRLLEIAGAGSEVALLRTTAQRIEFVATIADSSTNASNDTPFTRPGFRLLVRVLKLGEDYASGDEIEIIIPPPPEDCDADGVDDATQIGSAATEDCDDNGILDACETDTDSDGIIDPCDNCPDVENLDQTDSDDDGIGDACSAVGACCLADGTCEEKPSYLCSQSEGTYKGDATTCADANCPQPMGACQLPGPVCEQRTEEDCLTSSGTYQGDGTSCPAEPPVKTGACCFSDGACVVKTSADCVAAEGIYRGDDTTCATASCTQPAGTGACCRGNGQCTITTEADCNSLRRNTSATIRFAPSRIVLSQPAHAATARVSAKL
ncbi:MAG: thrombospondin type 3 repeat-containing protein [Planctomycetes bacterium]|nr:thrombospondin type 3 repeat-containing protein [Planctomycetota bacterium]